MLGCRDKKSKLYLEWKNSHPYLAKRLNQSSPENVCRENRKF